MAFDRATYRKQYNELNKEKLKAQQKEYQEQNKEKLRDYRREYREKNKDKIKERDDVYRELHRDVLLEKSKVYYETNKELVSIRSSARYRTMRGKYNSIKSTSAKPRNIEFSLSIEEFEMYFWEQPCCYCGEDNKGDIDRVDSSQGYFLFNCRPCCKKCNYMKKDLSLDDFEKHITKVYMVFQENAHKVAKELVEAKNFQASDKD